MIEVSEGDELRIIHSSFDDTKSLELSYMIQLDDGRIVGAREEFSTVSLPGAGKEAFKLPKGKLMRVSVRPLADTVQQFNTFATLKLARSSDSAFQGITSLTGGFIGISKHLIWPESPPQDIFDGKGTPFTKDEGDGTAGQNFDITVPSNEVWQLNALRFRLATDGNTADRVVSLIINPTSESFDIRTDNVVNASTNMDYGFVRGWPLKSVESFVITYPLFDYTLVGDDVVRIAVSAQQAGDDIENVRVAGHKWMQFT